MNVSTKPIVLTVKNDYPYRIQSEGEHLSRREQKKLLEPNKERLRYLSDRQHMSDWDLVEKVTIYAIEDKFPEIVKKNFDLSIRTVIYGVSEGSLSLLIGILLGGYDIVSKYKDFYESSQLLAKQLEFVIDDAFIDNFDENFKIQSQIERQFDYNPKIETLLDDKSPKENMLNNNISVNKQTDKLIPSKLSLIFSRREVFFYYLFILNITLLLFIGILVYKAVTKTYFG